MFIRFVTGVVLSTYGFYQLKAFPEWWSFWVSLLLLLTIALGIKLTDKLNHSLVALSLGLIIGFQWVFFQSFLTPTIPTAFLNKAIEVQGEVVGLPEISQGRYQKKIKFELLINRLKTADQEKSWSFSRPKIKLNWYQPLYHPRPGKNGRFIVKLKVNHGLLNPGGFDYETYLFKEQIAATGYVLSKTDRFLPATNANFQPQTHLVWSLSSLRAQLAEHLSQQLEKFEFKGIFKALIYGDKSDISSQDWAMLQATGTIHLMAISGLHIGLIAGLGFIMMGWLWRGLLPYVNWVAHIPKIYFSANGALMFATVYMVLAGASIPTQRAWLMVFSMVVFVFIRRRFQPFSALALAAFLVVIGSPTSVLSPGFWLSFSAVLLIFLTLKVLALYKLKKWQVFLIVQGVLSVGLIPMIAFYYQAFPVYSIIANFIAVPFVTLVGLPLLGVSVLVSFISDGLAGMVWEWNDWLWQPLWQFLYWVAGFDGNLWPLSISLTELVVSYLLLFAVYFYAMQYVEQKQDIKHPYFQTLILGLAMFVLFLGVQYFLQPSHEKLSKAKMTLLDVGQGQAVLFQTENHTLLYDTGPYWSDKLDGGKMAILPYLKKQSIKRLDLVIVSHSDSDHAGGLSSILQGVEVNKILSGQAAKLNKKLNLTDIKPCQAGQAWYFDALKVEVLAPLSNWGIPKSDNDQSCVVRFSIHHQAVLVMGDLTQSYEKKLVDNSPSKLTADILIAGHHGSKTSSSQDFLNTVLPSEVLFSTGYRNRFHFPHPLVLSRVAGIDKKVGQIQWWNTACEGAITYEYNQQKGAWAWHKQESYRASLAKWYHHACSSAEKGRFYQ